MTRAAETKISFEEFKKTTLEHMDKFYTEFDLLLKSDAFSAKDFGLGSDMLTNPSNWLKAIATYSSYADMMNSIGLSYDLRLKALSYGLKV